MKKHTLTKFGILLQLLGIIFMLYGLNNNRFLLWTGLPIIFIGLVLILVSIISNKDNTK